MVTHLNPYLDWRTKTVPAPPLWMGKKNDYEIMEISGI